MIQTKAEILLNQEIVKTLVSIVPLYPVGARIRITEAPTPQLVGFRGAVARDNPEDLAKPQILLYETKKGHRTPQPLLIDLAKHSGFELELLT